MIIHGREIKFKRTVGAICEISENCPDKSINKLTAFLNNGTVTEKLLARASFIIALSKGYDDSLEFNNPDGERTNLSYEEVLSLGEEEFAELFEESIAAWQGEKPTIEVEEPKKKARKKTATSD